MSHSVVIEITIPLASGDNLLGHAMALTQLKEPLDTFMGLVGKGATQKVRIVKTRTDAGQPRTRTRPAAVAAE